MRAHRKLRQWTMRLVERWIPAPAEPMSEPFCAVVGLHSSGSSALAGVLYHLGAHLGHKLGGHYGRDPQTACGFEAAKLADLCERAIPFPATRQIQPDEVVSAELGRWIHATQREAKRKQTIAAGKYPMMCRLGSHLLDICGRHLQVIHIDRPLAESVLSLQRRCPQRLPEVVAAHQRWLWEGKQEFLASLPCDATLSVTYESLLADPRKVARQMSDFVGLGATAQRVERAAASIDLGKRHVRVA